MAGSVHRADAIQDLVQKRSLIQLQPVSANSTAANLRHDGDNPDFF
jgi:hypothetical protein